MEYLASKVILSIRPCISKSKKPMKILLAPPLILQKTSTLTRKTQHSIYKKGRFSAEVPKMGYLVLNVWCKCSAVMLQTQASLSEVPIVFGFASCGWSLKDRITLKCSKPLIKDCHCSSAVPCNIFFNLKSYLVV